MGNCLPSCQKRNKVVVPLRVYPANVQRAVPTFILGMELMKQPSPKFGSESSLRSSKPATIDQNTTFLHEQEAVSELSFTSFISAANSFRSNTFDQNGTEFDSVLVKCVRSNSEFDYIKPIGKSTQLNSELVRPPAPSPRKMKFHYSLVNESELAKTDIMGQNQVADEHLEHKSLPQPDVVVNGKIKDAEDKDHSDDETPPRRERPRQADYKARRPKFTDPLIICDIDEDEFQDIFTDEDQKIEGAKEDPLLSELQEAIDYILTDKPPPKEKPSKRERSASACFDHSDDEQTQEAPPRRERPRQADYKARRPKFTDPLIICDIDDEEFRDIFTDEDQKIEGAKEDPLLSELQEAIDYILTDKPTPKEKPSKPERVASACFDHSDDEQTHEALPRKERPRQADYKARRPKFTDPLIICDIDDDEFQDIFTDEDQKIDGADETLSVSELQEAIDYILTDKPLSKEKPSNRTGHIQAEVQEDKEFVSVADVAEGACVITPEEEDAGANTPEEVHMVRNRGSEESEQIAKLRKQLHSTICYTRKPLCDEPVRKGVVTDSESELGSGLVAAPNTPRRARPRPPKTKPVHGSTLPSVLACSSRSSRSRGERGKRGGVERTAAALYYNAEELNLMDEIERRY